MKIREIIFEAPAQTVGQAAATASAQTPATAPDPQVAADKAARKRGFQSGLTKWATGQSELDSAASTGVKAPGNDQTLLTALIDSDPSASKTAIQNLKAKLPTVRLPWTIDINTLNVALDQALTDKPLDQEQIKSLKNLQQHLKKV